MRTTIIGRTRGLVLAMAVLAGAAGATLFTSDAVQAAVAVHVESQITAHNLPYLNSPYIDRSTLYGDTSAAVECQTRGREYIGGSLIWYRINSMYYPEYAFAPASGILPCGVATEVPLAANGYSSPSFSVPAAEGWFDSGEDVRVLCTAAGQTHEGSDAWFFTKGYWLHSTRLKNHPNGNGYSTCRGYNRPGDPVAKVIDAAEYMLGRYPYSWGGGNKSGPTYGICCSPSGHDDRDVYGFDCSGLTQYAFYKGAGIDIGSTSRTQYANGYKVALSQRRAGDLIFWSNSSRSPDSIHHVAIYVGGGLIIEATRASSGPDIRRRNFSTGESGVMPYVVRPIR